jgi:hypothetical protein
MMNLNDMWEVAVMAYFNTLSYHVHLVIEENHEEPQNS